MPEGTTTVQGGAQVKLGGSKSFTKTLFTARVKQEPENVRLFATSHMGPQFSGTAAELPKDMEFLVVGPNPYNQRDWYAKVKWDRTGKKLVVS